MQHQCVLLDGTPIWAIGISDYLECTEDAALIHVE